MAAAAVRVRGLRKRYAAREALAGLDLDVSEGECLALFGPNGAGKTTLLRILATLIEPTSGTAEVAGCALPAQAQAARARLGVHLDHGLLPRELKLEEALRFYAELYGVDDPEAIIRELAGKVGLENRLYDPVRTLSHGMAQRAGLIRAVLHRPRVLLLDEPFNGLDAASSEAVHALLAGAIAEGCTVVLATHDLARGAALARRALLLIGGRAAAEGPAPDIAARATDAAGQAPARAAETGAKP